MPITISPLLSVREVRSATCLGPTSLRNAVKIGEFPSPVRVGLRRVAWRVEDVQRWIDSRPVAVLGVSNGR